MPVAVQTSQGGQDFGVEVCRGVQFAASHPLADRFGRGGFQEHVNDCRCVEDQCFTARVQVRLSLPTQRL